MHSWVTWLSGDVTIRVEWPGGMYDNGFLRGWGSTHQGCLISLLWLKIYNFPLLQSNYNESRRVLETCAYFSNFSCCVSVVAVIINRQHLTSIYFLAVSLLLQGSTVRNDSAAFPLSSNFLSPFVTTISNPLKWKEWAQAVVEVTCPEKTLSKIRNSLPFMWRKER